MLSQLKRFMLRLPGMRKLQHLQAATDRIEAHLRFLSDANTFTGQATTAHFEYAYLRALPRYDDPKKLNRFEHQVFSQNGEDGIIAEIFRRIGTTSREFVEVGAGYGLENNTAFLLLQGWSGGWIEAEPRLIEFIKEQFCEPLRAKHLRLTQAFVTPKISCRF